MTRSARVPARGLAAPRLVLALPLAAVAWCAAPEIRAQEATGLCVPAIPCSDPRGCPDLVVDPDYLARADLVTRTFLSTDCAFLEGDVKGTGDRRLLRFDTVTPNLGPGALVIGKPRQHRDWFDFRTCHNHPHLKKYATNRLWTPKGYKSWTDLRAANPDACAPDLLASHPELFAELLSGEKHAFCVVDVLPPAGFPTIPCPFPAGPRTFDSCIDNQGISVCWADGYEKELDGQWVDVTDTPDGSYVLEVEINAEHFIEEADYHNNSAALNVRITNGSLDLKP